MNDPNGEEALRAIKRADAAYQELQRAGFQLACVQRRYRRAVVQYDRLRREADQAVAGVGAPTAEGVTAK